MRAQKGGAHVHGLRLAQGARHLQALAFVLQCQAVAGLDFQRGHALGHQRPQALVRTGLQIGGTGGARGLHGGGDATTGAG